MERVALQVSIPKKEFRILRKMAEDEKKLWQNGHLPSF